MSDFVHLHCHTEYSLLDGAIRLKDLCAKAKDFGGGAAAITDHGNLYGAVNFYLECQKVGIKPIIGCEVYVAARSHTDKDPQLDRARYHLVLLAQNNTGYQNLLKVVSKGHLDGFFYKPRVDKQILADHSEGLIALSACLAGEVPRMLMNQGMDKALATAREYEAIYPGRFYLELQSNGIPEQDLLNAKLLELAEATKFPLVATNDCHYLSADDVEAHDILLCIQTAACVDDEKRMRFDTKELYYKTPEEMAKAFEHVPEAIANTGRIAEMCDVKLDLKSHHFPVYDLPEGKTLHDEFVDLCKQGLAERLEKHPDRESLDEQLYQDRMAEEIEVIAEMGFEGYFLIVQDFINWAKDNRIPVGPGRGSAAGSLVAWAMKITNLDPIPYNLLFERFLNRERVSMPDIDVDFCERRRTEVISYVTEKYGSDSVAQITTFGKMKAKAVVRDVGRALGMSFGETDKIAKLIPEEMKMTIEKALDMEPELLDLYRTDDQVRRLLDISKRLEGLSRHSSTHAAGVVIGDKPLTEYLPLYKGKKEEVVTQFDMKMVEKVGLIKFDFLGLRTMTVVQDTLDIIERVGKEVPDLDNMPLTDQATYDLYSRGDTDGVFQVESSGMQKYLRQLKPSCFDDVIAMLALYRPGPLGSGMVDEFILRKHGQVPVTYPLPSLEPTLKDTYGVIVYQEQVMQIAQVVAKYTLGGADLLRRAMGKKIAEAMAQERARFVEGAKQNEISPDKANEIFDLMEKFAAYGFNKSHSAAYALISYYTAYLKAHFPTEFMAALMTSELGNQDKVLKYITCCRDMGIAVLPPDINQSYRAFTAITGEDGQEKIVFGLGGVKNVGDEAIREIVEAREQDGPFSSMLDMCCRVNMRKVTKRVVESLVKSGALDCLGCSRAGLLTALDQVAARAQKQAKDRDSGQLSLLGMTGEEPQTRPGVGFDCPEQDQTEFEDEVKSRFEKEALGFFLTSHPLLPLRMRLKRMGTASLADIREYPENAQTRIALVITDKKERINKKGDKWAVCNVEDLTGMMELLVFSKVFQECREHLDSDQPLLVTGTVLVDEADSTEGARQVKLRAESVIPLASVAEDEDEPVPLELDAVVLGNGGIQGLKDVLAQYPGRAPVHLTVRMKEGLVRMLLGPEFTVSPGEDLDRAFQTWARSKEVE